MIRCLLEQTHHSRHRHHSIDSALAHLRHRLRSLRHLLVTSPYWCFFCHSICVIKGLFHSHPYPRFKTASGYYRSFEYFEYSLFFYCGHRDEVVGGGATC